MKKLSLLFLFTLAFYGADAGQYDTTRGSGVKSATFITLGVDLNYLPLGDLNSKLFGGDKQANVQYMQGMGAINLGIQFNHFFYSIGFERGSDIEESDKYFSKINLSNFNLQFGYLFNRDRKWTFSGRFGLGYSDYTINSYSKMNAISFDSLLIQANGPGVITRSIDLVSNYNFYIHPQIGLEYRVPSSEESKHNTTFAFIGGCRIFTDGLAWHTLGRQALSNMPMNFNFIPTLEFQVRYEWGR